MTRDTIDVVLLGMYYLGPQDEDYVNGRAATCAEGSPCPLAIETWKILREFFQSRFVTYGRTVVLHIYNPDPQTPGQVVADTIDSTYHHPFAVVVDHPFACPNACYTGYDGMPSPTFNARGSEYFDLHWNAHGYPSIFTRYPQSSLSSPYYWSFLPSIDDDVANAASWICRSVARRVVTESAQFVGQRRRIALGYDDTQYQGIALELQSAVDQLCGAASGGHVFDQVVNVEGTATVAEMQHPAAHPTESDTSLLCVWCSYQVGVPDDFTSAEIAAQYFPEFIFVAGLVEDPTFARLRPYPTFDNAFGVSELWQVPAYANTYWFRAFRSVDPGSAVSQDNGLTTYEMLMQLFSAIQLAGPRLNAATATTGLYGWQRGATFSPNPLLPPASPAAGYTPADHSFLKGMIEQRWDTSGVSPTPYDVFFPPEGCYRVIDHQARFGAEPFLNRDWGLSPWPTGDATAPPPSNGDHSAEVAATAPCTGDYQGFISGT